MACEMRPLKPPYPPLFRRAVRVMGPDTEAPKSEFTNAETWSTDVADMWTPSHCRARSSCCIPEPLRTPNMSWSMFNSTTCDS